MKKIFSIIVLGLSLSILSACDILKSPQEICMNTIMNKDTNYKNDPAFAARMCALANKGTKKCMKMVMKDPYLKNDPVYAARQCTGAN